MTLDTGEPKDWSGAVTVPYTRQGTIGNNDLWQTTFGPFDSGTTITYYVTATDSHGNTVYDNNNEANHVVNIP